jgi:predicted PurR-regulated permease PerM
MTKEKMQHNLLYILLALVAFAGLYIISPYFKLMFMAMMFAILFKPLHKRVDGLIKNRKVISSLVATLIVMFIVVIPISLIGFQVFQEAKQVYLSFVNGSIDTSALHTLLATYMPQIAPAFSADINQYIAQALQWLMGNLSIVFSSVAGMLIQFFLMLFCAVLHL